MLKRSTTLSPKSTFVFLVGVCGEWERGRAEEGDVDSTTLVNTCGIPRNHIVHVKDRNATRANIIKSSTGFLALRRRHSRGLLWWTRKQSRYGNVRQKALEVRRLGPASREKIWREKGSISHGHLPRWCTWKTLACTL